MISLTRCLRGYGWRLVLKPGVRASSIQTIQFVRFPKERLEKGMEFYMIDGVRVPIFGVAKTLPTFFAIVASSARRLPSRGLGKPFEKASVAGRNLQASREAGVWTAMQPYVEALTLDG